VRIEVSEFFLSHKKVCCMSCVDGILDILTSVHKMLDLGQWPRTIWLTLENIALDLIWLIFPGYLDGN
jgi:hypothetical protein